MIIIDNDFVKRYAKKIMGFAYNKTQNTYMAEDLASEIMLQLTLALSKNAEIENMDAFVSTLCKYTWSNFLKKNKKHWDNYDIEDVFDMSNSINIEQQVETNILTAQLRKEVSYLSKLHRQIIKAFYFDNKSTKIISAELKLNENTVRWHLSETRKELKEAMELREECLDYEPVRMWCGHDGYCPNINMYGMSNDILVQNIVYACYGEPLSIGEIARKLNVSAAYIESHVYELAQMDYLQEKKGKYQTTFYIETLENMKCDNEFAFKNIGTYADTIFEAIHKRMDDILNIKFLGYDYLNRDDIEWMTYNRIAQELGYGFIEQSLEIKNIQCPLRSDGSRHWVCMGICGELQEKPEIKKYAEMCRMNGYRYNEGDFAHMIVSENYLNRTRAKEFRDIGPNMINNITKVYRLIKEGRTPDEFEKIIISELVREGYVKVVDEKPQLTIMYFTKDENEQYVKIIEEIKSQLGYDFSGKYLDLFQQYKMKQLPSFISKAAKEYYSQDRLFGTRALAWIIYNNRLSIPTGERALSVCTMVFEVCSLC